MRQVVHNADVSHLRQRRDAPSMCGLGQKAWRDGEEDVVDRLARQNGGVSTGTGLLRLPGRVGARARGLGSSLARSAPRSRPSEWVPMRTQSSRAHRVSQRVGDGEEHGARRPAGIPTTRSSTRGDAHQARGAATCRPTRESCRRQPRASSLVLLRPPATALTHEPARRIHRVDNLPGATPTSRASNTPCPQPSSFAAHATTGASDSARSPRSAYAYSCSSSSRSVSSRPASRWTPAPRALALGNGLPTFYPPLHEASCVSRFVFFGPSGVRGRLRGWRMRRRVRQHRSTNQRVDGLRAFDSNGLHHRDGEPQLVQHQGQRRRAVHQRRRSCRWRRTRSTTTTPTRTIRASRTTSGSRRGTTSGSPTTTIRSTTINRRSSTWSRSSTNAGISWKSYQEGIDGTQCPLDEHLESRLRR